MRACHSRKHAHDRRYPRPGPATALQPVLRRAATEGRCAPPHFSAGFSPACSASQSQGCNKQGRERRQKALCQASGLGQHTCTHMSMETGPNRPQRTDAPEPSKARRRRPRRPRIRRGPACSPRATSPGGHTTQRPPGQQQGGRPRGEQRGHVLMLVASPRPCAFQSHARRPAHPLKHGPDAERHGVGLVLGVVGLRGVMMVVVVARWP